MFPTVKEWLSSSLSQSSEATASALAGRLALSLLMGMAVAAIYRWARRGQLVHNTFLATLVLLSVLIAMATQIIGDNIARAFSLVGALSVVRFRTVVRDSQDTAFVIFAVVVGMSCGAQHALVGFVGLGVLACAAPLLWPRRNREGWASNDCRLDLRVASLQVLEHGVVELLTRRSALCSLIGLDTKKKSDSIDVSYHLRLRPESAPALLLEELSKIEGVHGVDLRHFE